MTNEHRCEQNDTRNEVWVFDGYSIFTILGDSKTGHFEHNERINFCPYCGKDLRKVEDDQ